MQVRAGLHTTTGRMSTTTISDRLHERSLHARRPTACPYLKSNHRHSRRIWGEDHLNWGVAEWSGCTVSDECRFALYGSDGHILMWRRRNEGFAAENME